MESYQSNIELISTENNTYRFTDKDNTYQLDMIKNDSNIDFTLRIEGGVHSYKATLAQTDLAKFDLFRVVGSLDTALQIIKDNLKNKGVTLKFDQGYLMTFFNLFYGTYVTAFVLFTQVENKLEHTVTELSDIIISQHKEIKNNAEEINSLKTMVADMKDLVINLKNTINDRFMAHDNTNMALKNSLTNLEERMVIQEGNVLELKALKKVEEGLSYSKILKTEDIELLKTWLGPNLKLEPLYSSYRDGDYATDFHSRCDGISPTLTVVQSNFGNRFGGYTNSKWHSLGEHVKGDGNNFIFSLDNKAKYQNTDLNCGIFGQKDYSVLFGRYDLYISNGCTSNQNSCCEPTCYAIPSTIAGGKHFSVKFIEVFKVIT
jgi:hypothetical protein